MRVTDIASALVIAFAVSCDALAEEGVSVEGRKLYATECMVCHGENRAAGRAPPQFALRSAGALHPVVALPHGPNLRGIVGRPAGSVKGFQYSSGFAKALNGKVWSEAELDRWLTDSQLRAPGSTMFYKQKDAEVRRKIIAYLKANP